MRTTSGLACLAILVMISGCTAPTPTSVVAPASLDAAPPEEPELPSAWMLKPIADANAKAWHPNAKLILAAVFEGTLPSSRAANPWADPYRNQSDGQLMDGRSTMWSFSYAIDDDLGRAAMTVCSLGVHAELREAHVVTVDAAGNVIAAFETRDDDEGSSTSGWLPDGLMDSSTAAAKAWGELAQLRVGKDWSRTFLAMDWFGDGPIWVFSAPTLESSDVVAVHAETGRVFTQIERPKC